MKCNGHYLRSFLKKLIVEVESNGDVVLDEIYEMYIYCLTSLKVVSFFKFFMIIGFFYQHWLIVEFPFLFCCQDDELTKGNARTLRRVSFLLPKGEYFFFSFPFFGMG